SSRRLKRLACLKQIQSLSQNNQELEMNLKEAFNKVMHFMGYRKGVLYRSTFNSPEMFLLSHFSLTPEEILQFYGLNLSEGFYNDALKTREVISINQFKGSTEWQKLFPDGKEICAFACVPLKYSSKVFGLLCIYDSDPERFVFEEAQFLASLKDAFGLMIEQSLLLEKTKIRQRHLETADEISKVMLESKSYEEDLPSLAHNLRKVFDFDYLSLSLVEGSGKNVKKFSLGIGENILLDKNANLPVYGTSIGWVIDSGEPLLESDVESKGYYEDNLSKLLGIRSKIVLPLKIKDNIVGILSLGSKYPNLYNAKSIKKLSLFSSLFSLYLQRKKLKDSINQEQEYFQTFSTHLLEFLNHGDLKGYLDGLSENLTQILPVSFCRISFLNPEKNNLELYSSYKRREDISFLPQGSQPLEALPWHRLALEIKKPMLINQDDPESTISREESALFLAPNLKSALLMPLVHKDKSFGLISLGEMRSWERRPFRKKEIDFMEKIGEQVNFVRKQSQSREFYDPKPRTCFDPGISQLGLEVNNSLTSIIGSLELLNLKKNLTEEKSERYLKIIEKGAWRIKDNMEKYFDQQDSVLVEK
ncbi:MAG: GAF domain-containing protein, partial [candidate division Zixibacteria bacterium]|nr:GAF domain-containing protein [candidate division Zixibacteria bacterium]